MPRGYAKKDNPEMYGDKLPTYDEVVARDKVEEKKRKKNEYQKRYRKKWRLAKKVVAKVKQLQESRINIPEYPALMGRAEVKAQIEKVILELIRLRGML